MAAMVAEPLTSEYKVSPVVFGKLTVVLLLRAITPVLATAKLAELPPPVLHRKFPAFVKSTLTNVKTEFGVWVINVLPAFELKVTRPVPKVTVPAVLVKAPDKVVAPAPNTVVPLVFTNAPPIVADPDPKVVVPLLLLNAPVIDSTPAPNVVVPLLRYDPADKVPVFAMLTVVPVFIVRAPETATVAPEFKVKDLLEGAREPKVIEVKDLGRVADTIGLLVKLKFTPMFTTSLVIDRPG
jgi:hypothetical protein